MSDSIKVAIKVRPLIKRELDDGLPIQWTIQGNSIAPLDPELKKRGEGGFYFDHIFDMSQTSDNLFNIVAKPIVDAAISGVNGTIFAYGQTSSGKTYTMMGSDENPGVIPLSVDYIFDAIANTYGREFLLRVSYIEIYNERINDLLDKNRIDLKVKEDVKGQVVVDCKEEVINSPARVMAIMKKGDGNRRTGETNMNERSSRSHTIFRITIESRESDGGSDGAVNVSQLNLVDLAGSERARQTGATGERFNEGRHINMSLSALGLVIMQLSECQDTQKYVNFRDSKLTRILQASLGGNAMTTIICAITPAAFEETQCTLAFASRAKRVKNKPQVNEVLSDGALLKRYAKQMDKLKAELEKAKSADVVEMESKLLEKERANQILEERIELLKKSIVRGSSTSAEDGSSRRAKRRRTWAGSGTLSSKATSPLHRAIGLPTIKELDKTPEKPKIQDPKKRRRTIIQTIDVTNQPFQTEFTDFELELIESERARCDSNRLSDGSSVCDEEYFITKRPVRNVKFEDDVAFIGGSFKSAETTPERQPRESSGGEPESPTTPKIVLRNRIIFLMEEYNALRKDHRNLEEFTKLEKQMFVDDAVEEAMAEHNRILAASEEKCREITEKYANLEARSSASDNRLAELEQQLADSSNSIKALKLENQNLLDELNQSKAAKLRIESQINNIQKETSSIFANETYFEEMEVSDVNCESMNVNDTQNLEDVTLNKLDESKKSKELSNAACSEFMKQIIDKTNDELVTVIQELVNARFSLEDENSKLQTMLQRKIREADDVKNDIRELKSGIEKLHETIHVLTSENTDLTSKLMAEKEHAEKAEKSLQNTIEELNSSINLITEETTLLEKSTNEQDDHLPKSNETLPNNDDRLQESIAKFKKTIALLTSENEELSSNLMSKIEELDRLKDSKKSLSIDHECPYRDLSINLSDRNKLLEAENIELSNNLMEKIEEYDRAKDELDFIKTKLSSSNSQTESMKLLEISIDRSSSIDDEKFQLKNSQNKKIDKNDVETTTKTVDDLLRLSMGNDNNILPISDVTNDKNVDLLGLSNFSSNRSSHDLMKIGSGTESTKTSVESPISDPTVDELLKISFVTDLSISDDNSNDRPTDRDVEAWKIKAEMLQEQVDHLNILNNKLSQLKLTNCKECAHLAELNENRKTLKLEAKTLNRKLRELQEKFDRESADSELLRTKANEDLNLSVCDVTMNGSMMIEGQNLNVSFVEERVRALNRELDDLRDKHDRLADLYRDKCEEIDKLQDACSRETTPTPGQNDQPKSKRSDVKLEKLQIDMEKLRTDFRVFKKNISSISAALQKFSMEKTSMQSEIERLTAEKMANFKGIVDSEMGNEKIIFFENEIVRLREEIRDWKVVAEELRIAKERLEIEVESLRDEKLIREDNVRVENLRVEKLIDEDNVEMEKSVLQLERLKLLENEVNSLNDEKARLENLLQARQMNKVEDKDLSSKFDDSIFKNVESSSITIDRLNEEIIKLTMERNKLINEKLNLETAVEALKMEKINGEEKITKMKDETINERILLLENEILRLNEQTKISEVTKEDLSNVKSSFEVEIEFSSGEKIDQINFEELGPMEEKIEFLENEIERLKNHSTALTKRKQDDELELEFESSKIETNETSSNLGDSSMTQETMKYLENEVSRLSEEINNSNYVKEELESTKICLEAEVEYLKSEKIIFDEKITQTDGTSAHERIEILETEVERLNREIIHSKEVKEELVIAKSSLEAEVQYLKAEKAEKAKEENTSTAQQRIEVLEMELLRLSEEIDGSNTLNKQAETVKSTLENEIEILKENEKIRENYIEDLLEKLKNLESKSCSNEIVEKMENNDLRNNEDEDLVKTIVDLRSKLEETTKDLKKFATINEQSNERLTIVEKSAKDLEIARTKIENEIADLLGEKTFGKSTIVDLRETMENLRRTNLRLSELENLEKILGERELENVELKEKLSIVVESTEKESIDAKEKIEKLEIEINRLKDSLENVLQTVEDLENSNSSLKRELQKLKIEETAKESKMEYASYETLKEYEKMVEELRTKLQDITNDLQNNAKETAELNEQLTKLNEAKDELNEARTSLESQVTSLKIERDDLELNLADLRNDLRDLEDRNASLDLELQSLRIERTKIDEIDGEIDKKSVDRVDDRKIEETIVRNEELNEELKKLRIENAELTSKIVELEKISKFENFDQQKKSVTRIDDQKIEETIVRNEELKKLRIENAELTSKIVELEKISKSENFDQQKKSATIDDRKIEETIVKNEELNAELKKLRIENAELTSKIELEKISKFENFDQQKKSATIDDRKIEEAIVRNEELNKLRIENAELTSKIVELEKISKSENFDQQKKSVTPIDDRKIEETIIENEELNSELKKLRIENAELTSKIVELEKISKSENFDQQKKSVTPIDDRKIRETIVKNEELNSELKKLRIENAELTSKIVELEKISKSENFDHKKKSETPIDDRKIEETIVKNSELNSELKKLRIENAELTSKIVELKKISLPKNFDEEKKSANMEKMVRTDESITDELFEELKSARDSITKEIKSLKTTTNENEFNEKTISELFGIFVHTIMSKEREIIKALSDRYDREKRKLEENIRQIKDAEKRVTIWAKELETDIERTQQELVDKEKLFNERKCEIEKLQNIIKENVHENQLLNEKIKVLELDFNTLQCELEKNPEIKQNATMNSSQERERLMQESLDTRELELSAKLRSIEKSSKEKIEELTKNLEYHRTRNIELSNNLEGLEVNERQLKNIVDMKINELSKSNGKIEKLQLELDVTTENYNRLTLKHSETSRQIDEITLVLKTKCDKLSEYKTKLETITPEYDHLKEQAAERQLRLEKYKSEIECMTTINEKNVSTLKDRLDSEEIKSAGLRKQLNELANKNTTLQTEINILKTKCEDLERTNAKLTKSMRNSTSKIRAEEEMEDLRDENRTLKRNLEGASNRITDLQQMKTQMLEEINDLRANCESLTNENSKILFEQNSQKENLRRYVELKTKYDDLLRENNRIAMEFEAGKTSILQFEKKLKEREDEIENLKIVNKDLDDEMEDMVTVIHDLRRENAELDDKLYAITSSNKEIVANDEQTTLKTKELINEETKQLKSEILELRSVIENLKSQRETLRKELEIATTSLEIFRNENSELRGRFVGHQDRGDSLSQDSSRSASPAINEPTNTRVDNRRRRSRTELFNQKRHLEIFEPEKTDCCGECRCAVLRDEIRTLERELVTKNGEIAAMEIRIQSENFPHMKRCKDLEELLAASRRKCKSLDIELQKIREMKVTELSSECDKCRHWRTNKCDQSTQCLPKSTPIYLSGMSSGFVEEHVKMTKLMKDKETLKTLCRGRQKQIFDLQNKVKELERELNAKSSLDVETMDTIGASSSSTSVKPDFSINSRHAMKENVPTIWDYQRPATHLRRDWFN